jgi:hypothetical protein
MEDSYESAAALVCTIRCATAEHLVAFVGSLIGQQYSVSYACQLAQHALAFGHWCEARLTHKFLESSSNSWITSRPCGPANSSTSGALRSCAYVSSR